MDVSLDTGADVGSSGGTSDTDAPDAPPPEQSGSPPEESGSPPEERPAALDVSAQTLRDVTFREKFRGYHPDDVDEFLEQVAEGITYLQGRLREAQERVGDTDAVPLRSGPVENDEAMRRTLVLAQRTAELAIQEGQHEAERIQSEARARAEAIVSRAEEAARRTVEETNARLREEVAGLEAARQRLRDEVADLERYLEEQRQQLHASLSAALHRVEQTLPPASQPAPEPGPAGAPPVPWPEPVERTRLWGEGQAPPPPPVQDDAGDEGAAPLTVAPDEGDEEPVDDHEPARPSIWTSPTSESDDDRWATARPEASTLDDEDDDPFIAELRRAITDTSPLGPRDDLPEAPPERLEAPSEQEVPGGRRFRRKRR